MFSYFDICIVLLVQFIIHTKKCATTHTYIYIYICVCVCCCAFPFLFNFIVFHTVKNFNITVYVTQCVRYVITRNDNATGLSGTKLNWQDLVSKKKSEPTYKGKAVPLQAWSGPEGSRKLRFPDYMITAQDGGKVVSITHRPPLPPGNAPGNHFC
jgi:hypothetical protein